MSPKRSVRFGRSLPVAFLTAVLHLTATPILWMWFDFTTRLAGNGPFLTYVAGGAFLLGVLPAALVTTKRLVSPVVLVSILYVLSAYGTWSVYVAPTTPPTPVDPTPFGWFLIGWPVVAVAALLVGGVEFGLRRFRERTTKPTLG